MRWVIKEEVTSCPHLKLAEHMDFYIGSYPREKRGMVSLAAYFLLKPRSTNEKGMDHFPPTNIFYTPTPT